MPGSWNRAHCDTQVTARELRLAARQFNYRPQNRETPSCSAVTLENPRAKVASSSVPNCSDSAEMVLPLQFTVPGVPALGTVSPLRENAILKVSPSTIMSVPIRSQSGAKLELRIHACLSPTNALPGGTIGLGADNKRKLALASFTETSGRKK